MMQYIDKDALVAEIKMLKENANKRGAIGKVSTIVLCNELLSFIDTLEVKEVDLDKKIASWAHELYEIPYDDVERMAKYFYKLGISRKI